MTKQNDESEKLCNFHGMCTAGGTGFVNKLGLCSMILSTDVKMSREKPLSFFGGFYFYYWPIRSTPTLFCEKCLSIIRFIIIPILKPNPSLCLLCGCQGRCQKFKVKSQGKSAGCQNSTKSLRLVLFSSGFWYRPWFLASMLRILLHTGRRRPRPFLGSFACHPNHLGVCQHSSLSHNEKKVEAESHISVMPEPISAEECQHTRWLESNKQGENITLLGAAVNLTMASLKGITGVAANSPAMIADAGHSLSDLASDGVAYYAFKQARKPADLRYSYGYGKFEAVGSALCAMLIMGAGCGIGVHSVEMLTSLASAKMQMVDGNSFLDATPSFLEGSPVTPLQLAMAAAVGSIVSKEVGLRLSLLSHLDRAFFFS
jgi:hypothetical protein